VAIPSWRNELPNNYVGAKKWGTGINPVHSQPSSTNIGRGLGSGPYDGTPLESSGLVDLASDFGFTAEDFAMTGEGVDLSFMEYHPNLGDPDSHSQTGMYPAWGPGSVPVAQGTTWRSYKMGSAWKEQIPQQVNYGSATEGWTNKEHGEVNDAGTSDPSQYTINTSMSQRDLSKGNDSAQTRGTDDARHSIATRLTGIKIKNYSGGKRHEEMEPKEQIERPRPWLHRAVGTGGYTGVNDMYVSEPLLREIPKDAYQGPNSDELPGDQVWAEDYL
jgi:hypothetical protein